MLARLCFSTNVLPLAFHETYPGHHFQVIKSSNRASLQNIIFFFNFKLYRHFNVDGGTSYVWDFFQNCYKQQQKLPLYRVHPLYRRRFAIPFTYPTYTAYSEVGQFRVWSFGFNFVFLVFKTRHCFYNGEISSNNRSVLEVFRFCAWFNFVSDI